MLHDSEVSSSIIHETQIKIGQSPLNHSKHAGLASHLSSADHFTNRPKVKMRKLWKHFICALRTVLRVYLQLRLSLFGFVTCFTIAVINMRPIITEDFNIRGQSGFYPPSICHQLPSRPLRFPLLILLLLILRAYRELFKETNHYQNFDSGH